jgi:hypothetical protein
MAINKSGWKQYARRLLFTNRLLQVSQRQPFQARILLSAELERIAEDVEEFDRIPHALLLVEP